MAKKKDLTDATYLDFLGEKSAALYAPGIFQQIREAHREGHDIPLPLPTADLNALLDNTISALNLDGKLAWARTPDVRRSVFIGSWYRTMANKGLA